MEPEVGIEAGHEPSATLPNPAITPSAATYLTGARTIWTSSLAGDDGAVSGEHRGTGTPLRLAIACTSPRGTRTNAPARR
jgi:hypothetical protein